MSDDRETRAQLVEELAVARQQAAAAELDLRKERVVGRLWRQVVGTSASRDLEATLIAVRDGLQELDVPFEGCGVNLVDVATDPPTVRFHAMVQGKHWDDLQSDTVGSAAITRIWRSQEVVYRPDLETEDPYDEADRIRWRRPIRAILDVPFSHGTLAANSTQPGPFSPTHVEVLQEMAQVLSEAFRRQDESHDRRRQTIDHIRSELRHQPDRPLTGVPQAVGLPHH